MYGGIADLRHLERNLGQHAIPLELLQSDALPYDEFLTRRRQLMAAKLRRYFQAL
jgi:hypothetical protein